VGVSHAIERISSPVVSNNQEAKVLHLLCNVLHGNQQPVEPLPPEIAGYKNQQGLLRTNVQLLALLRKEQGPKFWIEPVQVNPIGKHPDTLGSRTISSHQITACAIRGNHDHTSSVDRPALVPEKEAVLKRQAQPQPGQPPLGRSQ